MGLFDFLKKSSNEDSVTYTLENVAERNQADPRHFLIPSPDEVANLKVGDMVRLIFRLNQPLENGCNAERMWLEISAITDGHYKGILTNQPQFITTINIMDELVFSEEHIATILTPGSSYDMKKLAIVSLDCLRRREINWAIRNEDLHHEKDSGWQFLTGYETPEEQEDPESARLITIDDVLMIEPLLETVLEQAGQAYYYDRQLNQFVEDISTDE
ncbi:immunity protein Imm33 domain-containing protein [Streptococcus plurextorum]|uniref:immunity protein Imm33 domain-containing protein n=1 Tax=Streptococcus plurextorum TaxID=456876 RepID=UPI00040776A1|nr:DUF2185 domain-containing protein [Streptococcus plurextorum]